MPNAPHPAEPSSKTHQGVGARIVRRIGGAVRGAFAGIARLRRPAAPLSGRSHPAPELEVPAAPKRPRVARRPRVAPPAPTRPGRIARWFGLGPRNPARSRRRRFVDDRPFTPDRCPGLTPEDCAILNTPVKDCPPEILRMLLTGLAQHIARTLPPELGLSDPQVLFATLWSRLTEPAGEAAAEAPAEAEQDAPQPGNRPGAQVPTHPDSDANAGSAAAPVKPNATVPPQSGRDRRRSPRHDRSQRRRRTPSTRGWRKKRETLPPPPRPYHACAGPP